MRLIDADALLKSFNEKEYGFSSWEYYVKQAPTINIDVPRLTLSDYRDEYGDIMFDRVFDAICRSLVDIKTQVDTIKEYGEWTRVGDQSWECSRCKEISCCKARFCPDCGSRMDVNDDKC